MATCALLLDQGKKEDNFPQRMLTYHYRLYDKYQKPIVSCAILTDENKNWRPSSYQVGLVGSCLSVEYLVIKIIDYNDKIKELEISKNPFANVILAQLRALKVKRKPDEERKQIKFAITRRLYEKGMKKEEVINLYLFIDWLIGLSKPFELEYLNEVYQLEEAKKMPYISNAERFGKEEGFKEGKLEVARHLLEEGIKPAIVKRATGFSAAKIKKLQQEIVKAHKKEKH